MASRGSVLDLEIPLPGTALSGHRHHAFVVSTDEFIVANSKVVLVSSSRGGREQVRFPFAMFLSEALYLHERGRPFEIARPVTPTLLATVLNRDLPERSGRVAEGFFTGEGCRRGFGALDALRVQFQLPGRMASLGKVFSQPRDVSRDALGVAIPAERLTIWRVRGQDNPWLVVSNDTYNLRTGLVHGLDLPKCHPPYPQGTLAVGDTSLHKQDMCLGASLAVLIRNPSSDASTDVLEEQLGTVLRHAHDKIDTHLAAIFGL